MAAEWRVSMPRLLRMSLSRANDTQSAETAKCSTKADKSRLQAAAALAAQISSPYGLWLWPCRATQTLQPSLPPLC